MHISIENENDREKRRQERDKIIFNVIKNLKISWWIKINLRKSQVLASVFLAVVVTFFFQLSKLINQKYL